MPKVMKIPVGQNVQVIDGAVYVGGALAGKVHPHAPDRYILVDAKKQKGWKFPLTLEKKYPAGSRFRAKKPK